MVLGAKVLLFSEKSENWCYIVMTLRKLLELQQLCKQQSEDVPERILACLLSLWTGVLCGWVDYSMPRAALAFLSSGSSLMSIS